MEVGFLRPSRTNSSSTDYLRTTGLVLEQQFQSVRAAAYFRAAAGDGYGCSLFHSGRRDHYDLAASKYKEFIIVAGATHGGTPCKDCPGGPYTNSIRNMFDYMAKWINTRWSANY
jgi:hypothetical protein